MGGRRPAVQLCSAGLGTGPLRGGGCHVGQALLGHVLGRRGCDERQWQQPERLPSHGERSSHPQPPGVHTHDHAHRAPGQHQRDHRRRCRHARRCRRGSLGADLCHQRESHLGRQGEEEQVLHGHGHPDPARDHSTGRRRTAHPAAPPRESEGLAHGQHRDHQCARCEGLEGEGEPVRPTTGWSQPGSGAGSARPRRSAASASVADPVGRASGCLAASPAWTRSPHPRLRSTSRT